MEGVELYLFRAIPAQKKLDIRLDKLDDKYGSPSIDDIERWVTASWQIGSPLQDRRCSQGQVCDARRFSRMMFLEMEALLGLEEAGEVSFEVSSPGAERQLILPQDLARFDELPLRVEYTAADGSAVTQVSKRVVQREERAGCLDAAVTSPSSLDPRLTLILPLTSL
jgi:ribosome maturation factor RimP